MKNWSDLYNYVICILYLFKALVQQHKVYTCIIIEFHFHLDMTCIQLKSRETKFWRHQKDNPATYLSTIEAVYYLVRDYHELFLEDTSYNGEYDNLLFFFSFMYQKIRTFYDGGKDLKAYKQRAKTKQICGEKTSEWIFYLLSISGCFISFQLFILNMVLNVLLLYVVDLKSTYYVLMIRHFCQTMLHLRVKLHWNMYR